MKKVYFPLVATATLLCFALTVAAQRPVLTFNQGSSSRWGTAANWTPSAGVARVPQDGDSIVIGNAKSVYIGNNATGSGDNLTVPLNNVIVIVQSGGTLTLGNGANGSNEHTGVLALTGNSIVSVLNGGKIVANSKITGNQITINGDFKFDGNINYSGALPGTGSGIGEVHGSARATTTTGTGTLGFSQNALPVVLMGFNANLTSTNAVKIDWNTQQEVNTDRFEVLRSGDGISWQTLATIKATGFSSTPKNYTYSDPAPQKGVNLYRLNTIDFDGNFGFSAVTNVRINTQGKISVFPNPTVNLVTVSLSEAPSSDWTFRLVNLFGQTVLEKKFGKDYSTASVNVGNFPTGNYSIEINIGSSKQIAKLVIAH